MVICTKTAEPIEIPFGMWDLISSWNHVLDGSPERQRDVAVAINFGTQFAIIGFFTLDGL